MGIPALFPQVPMNLTDFPDNLASTTENPVPKGMVSGILKTRDGIPIRYGLLKTDAGNPIGTVIILQGRNESIEKYFETATDLAKSGFDAVTFDWRGQGGSARARGAIRRGYIESFHDHVSDLEDFFVQIALPDCRGPFYILAHSAGSLVALLSAPMLTNRVDRMVLSAPLFALENPGIPSGLLHTACAFMHYFGLGKICITPKRRFRVPLPFEGNKLTHDPVRFGRNSAIFQQFPQLATGCPTASWMNAALNAASQVTAPSFCEQVTIPVLMIAAGADTVVSNHAIEDQASRLRSGSMLTIDGARHEILQEEDHYREQVLAAFKAFVPGKGASAAN
jgi:lysophospholipase